MAKSSGGTTHVAVKNSNLGVILLIVAAIFIIPGMFGSVTGIAGDAADSLTKPIPGNANHLNEQARRHQTTPTTGATVSEEEMKARMAARDVGESLPPLAPPIQPGAGLPTLAGGNTGGIIGELPVVGNALKGIGPAARLAIGK